MVRKRTLYTNRNESLIGDRERIKRDKLLSNKIHHVLESYGIKFINPVPYHSRPEKGIRIDHFIYEFPGNGAIDMRYSYQIMEQGKPILFEISSAMIGINKDESDLCKRLESDMVREVDVLRVLIENETRIMKA